MLTNIILILNLTWNIILQRFIFVRLFIVRIFFARQMAIFTHRWLWFHCMIRTRFINFSFSSIFYWGRFLELVVVFQIFLFGPVFIIFKAMGKFIRSYNVFNLLLLNIIVRMLNPLLTAEFEPDRQHINSASKHICLETLRF